MHRFHLFSIVVAILVSGCAYQNFSGDVVPEDIFVVETAGNVMVGEKDHWSPTSGYSFHARGKFRAGSATFQAATDVSTDADHENGCVYENLRNITLTGNGGDVFVLLAIPVASNSAVNWAHPHQLYEGYDVIDKSNGRLIAQIR